MTPLAIKQPPPKAAHKPAPKPSAHPVHKASNTSDRPGKVIGKVSVAAKKPTAHRSDPKPQTPGIAPDQANVVHHFVHMVPPGITAQGIQAALGQGGPTGAPMPGGPMQPQGPMQGPPPGPMGPPPPNQGPI